MQTLEAVFEVYRDSSGLYRWRLRDPSGEVLARSPQAYSRKTECAFWLAKVKAQAHRAGVLDHTRYQR